MHCRSSPRPPSTSRSIKASEPSVPLRQIRGLGTLLRHEHRRIDPVVLWSVITEHLEPLDAAAAALLDRVPDEWAFSAPRPPPSPRRGSSGAPPRGRG
ncbi:DUF86 domain-containing protein [Methylobacterium terricola]|uniref:DUF86 domain-containing protein n=1 Tax=Methylobacterium terricola TaxID=2583531 RepID=A0A5C4LLH5_9HYPH|nr:DUF86 domain-containing protein [Methylobacterium terricola]